MNKNFVRIVSAVTAGIMVFMVAITIIASFIGQ